VIVVLAALLMVFLLGMCAFAIDLGVISLARTELQNAADSAALAGSNALPTGGVSAATAAAEQVIGANTVVGGTIPFNASQDLVFGTYDDQTMTFTPYAGSGTPNSMQVNLQMSQARGNALKLFFANVLSTKSASIAAGANIQANARATKTIMNCGPFVGLNYVNISGGSYTDSFNSTFGPYTTRTSANVNGHVCSNGNISITGTGAYIWGDAHPGPKCSVSTGGSAYVSGSRTALTAKLNEPAVNFGSSATVNNNNTVGNSTAGTPALDGSGNFALPAGAAITLQPGVYYFQTLSMLSGATINLVGATDIYVVGDVSMAGCSIVNPTGKAANCRLYSTGTTVSGGGGATFYGVVYAPTADITWNGSSDTFGMIVGNSLTLEGGGGFHYDEALSAMLTIQGSNYLVQ
jgi:Flp pilus assembly protein TadG